MAELAEILDLSPDEFAFYFKTSVGVPADELGALLQRASTVVRNASGTELRVVALRDGSLAAIVKAVNKAATAAGSAIGQEVKKDPVKTVSAAVAVAIAALVAASQVSENDEPTPLAKAQAAIVEDSGVEEVVIISREEVTTTMTSEKAQEVRRLERVWRTRRQLPYVRETIRELVDRSEKGTLNGDAIRVEDVMHFRPDGHQYLIPVLNENMVDEGIEGSGSYTVRGELELFEGMPHFLRVISAKRH